MAQNMKESGIEWIGTVPLDWGINTVFQIFSQVKNKNSDLREQNLLSLSYGKIKRKNIETTEGLLPESFDGYNIIEAGDIVLRLTDLQNDQKSLRVGLATERGIVTSAYLTLRNRSNSTNEYLYYYLHAFDISKGFYGMGAGVRQGLNWDGIKWIRILTPPLQEQRAIVTYLDQRCEEIERVIAETEKTIEEYKALKQAIISEAVIHGVRGNREMKDSGIEWIGQIPAEWVVSRLKYSIRWKSIKGEPNEQVLSLYRDYGVIPKDSRDDNYNVTSLDTSTYKVVDIGDFVINKMKAWQGSMAVSSFRGIISPAYHVCQITNPNINLQYFHYLMRNQLYVPEYLRLSTGMRIGQWDLGFDDFKNLPFILPTLEEQEEIVCYIEEKSDEIDRLIETKQQLLGELQAYKHSVIYEFVTGKKEVPVCQ